MDPPAIVLTCTMQALKERDVHSVLELWRKRWSLNINVFIAVYFTKLLSLRRDSHQL